MVSALLATAAQRGRHGRLRGPRLDPGQLPSPPGRRTLHSLARADGRTSRTRYADRRCGTGDPPPSGSREDGDAAQALPRGHGGPRARALRRPDRTSLPPRVPGGTRSTSEAFRSGACPPTTSPRDTRPGSSTAKGNAFLMVDPKPATSATSGCPRSAGSPPVLSWARCVADPAHVSAGWAYSRWRVPRGPARLPPRSPAKPGLATPSG